MLNNLWTAYKKTPKDNSGMNIMIRNQACYYIGRINLPKVTEHLREAYRIEHNPFVKLSISFGLIKKGQFDIEDELYLKLKSDSDWDSKNRGYHLVYYRDCLPEDAPQYNDPQNVSWRNTFINLLRHIESSSSRHIAMKRVELLTLRRFIETRGQKKPIDTVSFKRIEKALKIMPENDIELPNDFMQNIRTEFNALKLAWETAGSGS